METFLWLWFDLQGRRVFTASLILTEHTTMSLDVSVSVFCPLVSLTNRCEEVKLSLEQSDMKTAFLQTDCQRIEK